MNKQFSYLPKSSDTRQGALHAGIRYQYLKTILAWISVKGPDGYVVSEWVDDVFTADLPERFFKLRDHGDALLLWTKCLRLCSYCDRAIVDRFHQSIDAGVIESFVLSSGFHQLAYCAWTLSDIDRDEAKFILENAEFSPLMDSATELPARDFVRAIRRLRDVDVKWTQQFCNEASGDRDGPFFGLLRLTVDEFASAIGELNTTALSFRPSAS